MLLLFVCSACCCVCCLVVASFEDGVIHLLNGSLLCLLFVFQDGAFNMCLLFELMSVCVAVVNVCLRLCSWFLFVWYFSVYVVYIP